MAGLRGIGTLFIGLVILTAIVGITVYMVHIYRAGIEALREQQMLYEKARWLSEHTNVSGNTVSLPQPADLIIIDPSGVPHVARNVSRITLPWPVARSRIYVTVTGHLRIAASDPVAEAMAEAASAAASPLPPATSNANVAECSWYLDPYIYNITRNATLYRGYIPYEKMPQIGYFFYTSPKSLCTDYSAGSPMSILRRIGIDTDALSNNCPDIEVWDIAIIPWTGALVITGRGNYYIIYYNGSWRQLGGPWSLSTVINGVSVDARRLLLSSIDWKIEVNVSSEIMNVSYTRTKRFLASYNELWVSVSISRGYILAAQYWYTLYYDYYTQVREEFPDTPIVIDSGMHAYVKGPNYTYGLEGAAIVSPINAYIYERCG